MITKPLSSERKNLSSKEKLIEELLDIIECEDYPNRAGMMSSVITFIDKNFTPIENPTAETENVPRKRGGDSCVCASIKLLLSCSPRTRG